MRIRKKERERKKLVKGIHLNRKKKENCPEVKEMSLEMPRVSSASDEKHRFNIHCDISQYQGQRENCKIFWKGGKKQQVHTRIGNNNGTNFPNGNPGRLKTVSILNKNSF